MVKFYGMESFKASTQYGDWQGTAAADDIDAHKKSVERHLKEKGLIKPHEFLVATSFYTGEDDFVSIKALIFENGDNFESVKAAINATRGPLPVRRVRIELTAKEFLAMFKRFHVMLMWHTLELDGREYDAEDE